MWAMVLLWSSCHWILKRERKKKGRKKKLFAFTTHGKCQWNYVWRLKGSSSQCEHRRRCYVIDASHSSHTESMCVSICVLGSHQSLRNNSPVTREWAHKNEKKRYADRQEKHAHKTVRTQTEPSSRRSSKNSVSASTRKAERRNTVGTKELSLMGTKLGSHCC